MKRFSGVGAILVCGLLASNCSRKAAPPGPAVPEVWVTTVQPRDVPRVLERVATLDGFINANINAQVQGYIVSRDYTEGSIVKKGDLLFQIDPRPFEAALAQAQVELDKTIVYAGVDGTVEQFTLRKGDIVNPLMRPAGILVPTEAGRGRLVAGFGQIESQVMKIGMIAEVTCIAKPMTIIPMVVVQVQDVIAAGQVRPTDQLIDPLQSVQPGTLAVFLEPLYEGGFDGIPPGSHCIANAYTSNHDALEQEGMSTARRAFLHAIDTLGLVHAMILRVQALLLPMQTLVLSGH